MFMLCKDFILVYTSSTLKEVKVYEKSKGEGNLKRKHKEESIPR